MSLDLAEATPVDADGVLVRALQQMCAPLEREVLVRVPTEEVEAEKPGGLNNSDLTATGWVWYYGELKAMHRAGAVVAVEGGALNAADKQQLQELLHEVPQFVRMQDGTERGVYPKGTYALDRVQMVETELRYVVPRRVAVEMVVQQKADAGEAPEPADLEVLATLQELQHTLQREFLWIATHPGADVPWPDDGKREHPAPEWTRAYDGPDLELVRDAFYHVNYTRLETIVARTRAYAGGADTLSAEAFAAIMANEAGIPASRFSREWSYGMAAATAFLKWEATQKADARAKAAA